jgi:hypothetical protein
VAFEPVRDRLRVAIGQEIERAVALKIHDDGSAALATAPGPIAIPTARGVVRAGIGAVWMRRSRVSPLTPMPNLAARRAPASPPAVSAIGAAPPPRGTCA